MKNPLPAIFLASVLIVTIAVLAGVPWGIGGVAFALVVVSFSTVVIGGVISNHNSRKRKVQSDLLMRQTEERFARDREAFRRMSRKRGNRGRGGLLQ